MTIGQRELQGNYNYTLSMLWAYVFVSAFPAFFPSPLDLISLASVPLLIVMWLARRDDAVVDWHGRELIRSTIFYAAYIMIATFLGGFFGAAISGREANGIMVGTGLLLLVALFALVNLIRQLIAAHQGKSFIYPFTFSPRR